MAVVQYSDPKSIPFVLAGEAWKKGEKTLFFKKLLTAVADWRWANQRGLLLLSVPAFFLTVVTLRISSWSTNICQLIIIIIIFFCGQQINNVNTQQKVKE